MTCRALRMPVRVLAVVGAAGLAVLAAAGTALAHVTATPDTAEKGSTSTIVFRVPDEDAQASTVKLDVNLPMDHPIASVRVKPVPGWTAQTTTAALNQPVTTDEGARLTKAVRTITWTAQPGAAIAPGQFQEFTILASTLPENTDHLVMPAIQTLDNGEVERWDQQSGAPGAAEPEHPAPTVTLVAGTETAGGSTHHAAAPATTGGDSTARWLAGVAIVVAALGLGTALGALLRGRRSPGANAS